jgi:zinc transporter
VVHLLRDQADVLVQIVRETGINVDQIEDQLLSQRLHSNRADLGAMRRGLVRLQRLLAPARRAVPPAEPAAGVAARGDLRELRESTEEFSLVLNDLPRWWSGSSCCRKRSPPSSTNRPTARCSR